MSAAQVLGRTQAGVAIVTKIALDCAAQVQNLAFTASLKRSATPEQANERLGALLMAASLFKSDGKRRCLNSTLPSQQHPAP